MTFQGIAFGSLSPQDALDLAILVEEEARERYVEFADQMDQHRTPEAAGFFRHMAENEAKHGRELADRRRQRFGEAPRRVTAAMLFEVERLAAQRPCAPSSHRAKAMEAALRLSSRPRFFEAAREGASDPDVRALLAALRDKETQHPEPLGPPRTSPSSAPTAASPPRTSWTSQCRSSHFWQWEHQTVARLPIRFPLRRVSQVRARSGLPGHTPAAPA